MTARAVSSIRPRPDVTRETVYSFFWCHCAAQLRGFCCGLGGVDLIRAGLSWDELDPSDRASLREVLLDLLSGHEARREEWKKAR